MIRLSTTMRNHGFSSLAYVIIGCILGACAIFSLMQKSPAENLTTLAPFQTSLSLVRFQSRGTKCEKQELNKTWAKSQAREDEKLHKYFNGLCNGVYIEMGALDGISISNSYLFHKQFGWKGMLIELSPKNYKELVQNRPDELATVNAAVCKKKQMVHFMEQDGTSGVWEFADESFRKNWWRGVTLDSDKLQKIDCEPLADILSTHVPDHKYFDFFSLDVEGAEYEALASINFSEIGFGVLVIEFDGRNLQKELAIRILLESHGYLYLNRENNNVWFANKYFTTIYQNLLY